MRREDLTGPHLSPVLRLPLVERRTTDPVPPADLACPHARTPLTYAAICAKFSDDGQVGILI